MQCATRARRPAPAGGGRVMAEATPRKATPRPAARVAVVGAGKEAGFQAEARTFALAARMADAVFEAAGVAGEWGISPADKIQMRGGRGVRVGSVERRSIRLTIRPGNNDTCWRYRLAPLDGDVTERRLEEVRARLLAASEPEKDDDEADAEVPADGGGPAVPASARATTLAETVARLEAIVARGEEAVRLHSDFARRRRECEDRVAAATRELDAIDDEELALLAREDAEAGDVKAAAAVLEKLRAALGSFDG